MRRWFPVALATALVAVLLPSFASGRTAGASETKPVPGTAQTHNGVLLDTVFEKGKTYTLKISGQVVVDPYNPREWDAVYCFKSTNGTPCQPTPYAVCGLQLTWYRGTEYSHWTVFGCPGGGVAPVPYQDSHVYTQTIVPPFDARLKVGIGDTVPEDNTGRFTVTVTGPPPTTTKPPTCTRTYVVEPGGAQVAAQVHNTELTAKQVAAVLDREKGKYEGWGYTPIGEPTRKLNCAGFVMTKLFGQQMVDANVDPDRFFRAIVKPFGSKRIGRATAHAGDVVLWRDGGVVQHVAFVEAGAPGKLTILTKDGNERLYRMKLGLVPDSAEPLTQTHGSIEFWRVDRSKVKISVVSGKECGK